MAKSPPEHRPLKERLLWFVALYVAGGAIALTLVYALRAALFL